MFWAVLLVDHDLVMTCCIRIGRLNHSRVTITVMCAGQLLAAPAAGFFDLGVHLRLLLPAVDHASDRNSNPCALAAARAWARGACRDAAWGAALALVDATVRAKQLGNGGESTAAGSSPPPGGGTGDASWSRADVRVFVNSESNVVTEDLVRFLRAHNASASGFVYSGAAAAAVEERSLSGAPIDFIEVVMACRIIRLGGSTTNE